MPRAILQPHSGADPYILIEFEPHDKGWGWARILKTGVAVEPRSAASREECVVAAGREYNGVLHIYIPSDEDGLRQLAELAAAGLNVG